MRRTFVGHFARRNLWFKITGDVVGGLDGHVREDNGWDLHEKRRSRTGKALVKRVPWISRWLEMVATNLMVTSMAASTTRSRRRRRRTVALAGLPIWQLQNKRRMGNTCRDEPSPALKRRTERKEILFLGCGLRINYVVGEKLIMLHGIVLQLINNSIFS